MKEKWKGRRDGGINKTGSGSNKQIEGGRRNTHGRNDEKENETENRAWGERKREYTNTNTL